MISRKDVFEVGAADLEVFGLAARGTQHTEDAFDLMGASWAVICTMRPGDP